ncbi:HupE/UreJ family protein [Flavobacteriaceae bacterium LSUCC0859]|nr:HupE/UreJ family protein [Flavobacteriaceae bacterium LSUCC0859]
MKGAKHMLTSYDHLLFLLGVVFYLSKISEIISFNLGVELGQILALIPMV